MKFLSLKKYLFSLPLLACNAGEICIFNVTNGSDVVKMTITPCFRMQIVVIHFWFHLKSLLKMVFWWKKSFQNHCKNICSQTHKKGFFFSLFCPIFEVLCSSFLCHCSNMDRVDFTAVAEIKDPLIAKVSCQLLLLIYAFSNISTFCFISVHICFQPS